MKSSKYDFTKILEDIKQFFIKTPSQFSGKIFIVRNIYSRFGLYFEGISTEEFKKIKELIAKESFLEWVDSIEPLENDDYSRSAVNFNSYLKVSTLLNGAASDNPYKKMADIILSDKIETITGEKIKKENFSEIVKCLSKIIIDDVAASEEEFNSEEDLIKRFYPRKDYKYIFDPARFLILGDKGTGKTALFSVLKHKNYAVNLADYCGVDITEINNSTWISGYDKGGKFPSKSNFNSLENFSGNQFLNYWLLLLIRTIPPRFMLELENPHIKNFRTCKLTQLKNLAQKPETGEIIEEILLEIDRGLKEDHKTLFIVYDYLDLNLSTENDLRGKSIGSLLSLWYGYSSRIKNIKAKIFLRNDIFEREVITETDKVKIKNYAVDINWDYDQLLNVIWKRLLSVNRKSKIIKSFFSDFEKEINNNYLDKLGTIPVFSEKSNRRILDKLLGKYMGGNNKAFPYNWIIYHASDTKKKIFPRSMIFLFAQAAKKQLNDTKESKNPIRPYNMEASLGEVSRIRVADLKEEYPELANVFSELHTEVTHFPANESLLISGLKKIGETKPVDLIDKLKDIGVLYRYKDKAKQKEIRYHIPDLYLFGMNLRRRGPGAHKALFRK